MKQKTYSYNSEGILKMLMDKYNISREEAWNHLVRVLTNV